MAKRGWERRRGISVGRFWEEEGSTQLPGAMTGPDVFLIQLGQGQRGPGRAAESPKGLAWGAGMRSGSGFADTLVVLVVEKGEPRETGNQFLGCPPNV